MCVKGWSTLPEHDTVAHVLGVRFDCLTRREAVERILQWMDEGSRRMVITAGPEFVMMTERDGELKQIARAADLVTPDGIGVVWAARRQGHRVPERVTGVELVAELLDTAQARRLSLRVYVLGAREEALQACLTRFRQRYPELTFAGRNGYFEAREWPGILSEIESFGPNLWLVGLGQPRQERLIFESLGGLPPCVAIGVGGSIDVWGGVVKRAPAVFRRLNMEWLYRLLRQPSRWRRQLALPRFAWRVLRGR
ncbi:WecB/TagA/CpsF family glycosyltransferase [Alicyclobacillus macrosporangiidus]|uniref:WecB/TagA/CpsF family glycosyltransferase n=1 Tax=Alicyclobacillus macrosporangiidus TaxID=392015 RepID=UPI000942058A|nr:WecB/TagA/CpsF family glycosyltransferase [Alicyclobacillus macrosporangiidus]